MEAASAVTAAHSHAARSSSRCGFAASHASTDRRKRIWGRAEVVCTLFATLAWRRCLFYEWGGNLRLGRAGGRDSSGQAGTRGGALALLDHERRRSRRQMEFEPWASASPVAAGNRISLAPDFIKDVDRLEKVPFACRFATSDEARLRGCDRSRGGSVACSALSRSPHRTFPIFALSAMFSSHRSIRIFLSPGSLKGRAGRGTATSRDRDSSGAPAFPFRSRGRPRRGPLFD